MNLSYSLEDLNESIISAYRRLLPEQNGLIVAGHLDWKFLRNPAGLGKAAVCRNDSDDIVGIITFMPVRFLNTLGNEIKAYQVMDTVVEPVARRKGVFVGLIRAFYNSHPNDLLYGFPNASAAQGYFRKLGWVRLGEVPLLIKPLRTGFVLKRISKILPDVSLPYFRRREVDIQSIDKYDDDSSKCWFKHRQKNCFSSIRDDTYLNWRLVDNPCFNYVRLSKGNDAFVSGSIAEKHNAKIGYIMESFGDPRILPNLIAEMTQRFRDQKVDLSLAWCLPSSPAYAAYRKAGFYQFPTQLRPIEINFGAKYTDENIPNVNNPRNWYISYLDSDTV